MSKPELIPVNRRHYIIYSVNRFTKRRSVSLTTDITFLICESVRHWKLRTKFFIAVITRSHWTFNIPKLVNFANHSAKVNRLKQFRRISFSKHCTRDTVCFWVEIFFPWCLADSSSYTFTFTKSDLKNHFREGSWNTQSCGTNFAHVTAQAGPARNMHATRVVILTTRALGSIYLSNKPQVSMVYRLINHAGC